MKDNIGVHLTPNSIAFDGNPTVDEAVVLLASGIRHMLFATIEAASSKGAPEEQLTNIRDELFDIVNEVIGNTLTEFNPERSNDGALSIDEQIARENELIQTQLRRVQVTNPLRYQKLVKAQKKWESEQRAKILAFPSGKPITPESDGPAS